MQELLLLVAAALLAAAVYFYGWQLRRLFRSGGKVRTQDFDPADLCAAGLLVLLFLWLTITAATGAEMEIQPGDITTGAIVFGIIVVMLLTFLKARGRSLGRLFGLREISAGKAFALAALYLVAAVPLLQLVTLLFQRFLTPEMEPQEVVKFFLETRDIVSRYGVIVMAVLVAPLVEELIFRGYLYPVLKRYGGAAFALGFASLLFAMVHLNLPSLGALLVLAICLTLAYEATGSLLVPIAMHALFNATMLVIMLVAPPPV